MVEVGGVTLFASGKDLLGQIDQIKLGHILWQLFMAMYSSDEPSGPESPL